MKNGWEYEAAGIGGILVGIADTTGEIGTLAIGGVVLALIVINLVFQLKDKALIDRFEYK